MKPAAAALIRTIDHHRATSQQARTVALPEIPSFRRFLLDHARVKVGSGYAPYTFAGREPLAEIVDTIDRILGIPVAGPSWSCAGAGSSCHDWHPGDAPRPEPAPADWRPGQPVAAPNESKLPLEDASLAICGGAQFGKTVLMLNLLAYLVAVRFRNLGYYLPDDDLVAGVVDGKLRPDVLDQIPWLARLLEVGRTLSPTGRAVHRKGAMMCTDGTRTALAWMRGLGKIPTSFSMDAVIQDEKDDIPEARAKFLAGRMTASDLRFSLVIGTQRYHGAGQNREFENGTQHVALLHPHQRDAGPNRGRGGDTSASDAPSPLAEEKNGSSVTLALGLGCPTCRDGINPEEHWPQICRLAVTGTSRPDDPKLSLEGQFVHPDGRIAEENNESSVTLVACPECGAELDRDRARFVPRRPERIAARRWSYRISQLIIPAIGLGQIVRAYREAVRDPEKMIAFATDRLALPKSTRQQLTPALLDRARRVAPYALPERLEDIPPPAPGATRFAGLDTGDRCWLVVTEQAAETAASPRPEIPPTKVPTTNNWVQRHAAVVGDNDGYRPAATRVIWAEEISAERARARVAEVVAQLGVRTLLVDAGPLRDLARHLAFTLNPLSEQGANDAPAFLHESDWIEFGDGLVWDGPHACWRGLRAAAVEFTQRPGLGLRHKLARTQDGLVYPLLAANRDESIQRVLNDLLTAEEGVLDLRGGDGNARTQPALLLPSRHAGKTSGILAALDAHLLTGSRQETARDGRGRRFVGHCENHLLLALAYAKLAERLAAAEVAQTARQTPAAFRPVATASGRSARRRSTPHRRIDA